MCGRFSLGLPHTQVQELHGYNVPIGEWVGQDQFHPRHNIAPHSQAPVIRKRSPGGEADSSTSNANPVERSDEIIMQTMKWGLVPHWSKYEDKTLNTTNARSENLVEGGGMWGSIKGRKRCAIPCEGYYEWLKKGKERLPHFTKHKNGHLMLLAGLYDCVTLEGQTEPLWTFTIVTTSANNDFDWLHDRQPVILSTTEALSQWLDTSAQKWTPDLTKLVNPYADTKSPLECYQVPKEVGKVGTESPTFIQPISQRKDGIQAMFAKQKKDIAISSTTTKRKRSVSPPLNSQDQASDDVQVVEPETSQSKAKTQKLNTWEDDSDIEYVDKPTSSLRELHDTSSSKNKMKSSIPAVKSPSKPTLKNAKCKSNDSKPSSTKITSFFISKS